MTALDSARRTVALSSRILARLGILDAFGHVSARMPDADDGFLLSRALAPKRVRPEDVAIVGLNGEARTPIDAKLPVERYIHAEIYRARPEVGAVVHSHAAPVLPFSVVKSERVQPLCHICGFLHGMPEPYDVANHFGPATDLLIRNAGMGQSLATHLGQANVVLMRGHGFTAVGSDLPQATFRAYYTSKNCEIQMMARQLGEPTVLSDAEAQACERSTNAQIDRAWDLWVEDVEREDGLPLGR